MAETMFAPDIPWTGGPMNPEELEHRIQRLEEAVASLCDNSILEERLRGLVLKELCAELQRLKEAGGNLAGAESRPSSRREWSETNGVTAEGLLGDSSPSSTSSKYSFLKEIWADLSTLYRMIRDPFFKMSWVAKTVPLCALAYLAFNSWLPGLPTIPVLSQLDDLLVMYLGFKVLGRELRRYREHLNQGGGSG